jgi:hypothetical protein
MSKGGAATLAVIWSLLVIGVAAVVIGAPTGSTAANQVVDSWLQAMAQPSGDRGWSRLSPETQEIVYGDDPARFWSDLSEVEWSEVAWAPARGHVDDAVSYLGDVWLRSHPSTLPRFLVERGLAAVSCTDDVAFGIHLQMSVGWFESPRIMGRLGKGAAPDRCALAVEDDSGVSHEPFDIVSGAWASPGSIQRIGVLDSSGLVSSVGWGRADPPLNGPIAVTTFEPRQLAVTWRGAACDSNSTIAVSGTTSALSIVVRRGIEAGCTGSGVTYESILSLRSDVSPQLVKVEMAPAPL